MDLLLGTSLKICGEVVLRIHQNLLTNESDLSQITPRLFARPVAGPVPRMAEPELPEAQRISVGSNAQAAQKAAEEPGTAAIAGEAAAARYKLPKRVENIEDEPNNTTRFLVVGRHEAGPSGRDKTSLIMSAPNRTGALHELLLPFSQAGVSMSRLESRPARNALWEYVFYVDVEGHYQEPGIQAALADLGQHAAYLKVLGSYPLAVY